MKRIIWILMNAEGKPVRDNDTRLLAYADKDDAKKECNRWNKKIDKEPLWIAKTYIEFKKSWKIKWDDNKKGIYGVNK